LSAVSPSRSLAPGLSGIPMVLLPSPHTSFREICASPPPPPLFLSPGFFSPSPVRGQSGLFFPLQQALKPQLFPGTPFFFFFAFVQRTGSSSPPKFRGVSPVSVLGATTRLGAARKRALPPSVVEYPLVKVSHPSVPSLALI